MFARWLRGFLSRFDFSKETKLLIMIAFTGVMIFGAMNFLWKLSDKKTPPLQENTEETTQAEPTRLDDFVASNYRTLHDYHNSLKHRLTELHTFLYQDVKKWAKASPHQRDFLQNILDIRWESYKEFTETGKVVDLSLREFWIHYQTGQSRYVIKVFEEEANELIDKIKNTQAFDNTAEQAEKEETEKLLTTARNQLENQDIPRAPKNRKKEQVFQSYSEKNQQMLLDWLQARQNEGTLISSLEILTDNQNHIDRNLKLIKDYLKEDANRDLREPLQKIIQQWQDLGRYNLYAQYQILYAVEAEYIVEKLASQSPPPNTPSLQQSKASQQLYVHLREIAPIIAHRAKSRRLEEVEQSYSPSSFAISDQKKR